MDKATKTGWQTGLAALGVVLLAVPVLGISLSGSATSDALWTALRLAALEGFTLVFIDTLIGALRPSFNKVMGPRPAHRLHVTVGITGLTFVIAHPVMVLVYGLAGYSPALLWVGLAVLTILALTVATALARRRLRTSWRWIHRLNYLAFAVALIHGLALGFDLGAETWLQALFITYAAVVALAIIYRYTRLRSRRPSS